MTESNTASVCIVGAGSMGVITGYHLQLAGATVTLLARPHRQARLPLSETSPASVCIVGAGSMGVLTGYHLQLAGATVTFLVRPHRQEQLSRPQVLYSFDGQSLKTLSDYDLIADPAKLAGTSFDFVVITLDGAALRAEAGQKLVDEMGRAFQI